MGETQSPAFARVTILDAFRQTLAGQKEQGRVAHNGAELGQKVESGKCRFKWPIKAPELALKRRFGRGWMNGSVVHNGCDAGALQDGARRASAGQARHEARRSKTSRTMAAKLCH
jgi:hypothetical protein